MPRKKQPPWLKNKFRAIKTTIGKEKFDSKLESRVWLRLKAEEDAGKIRDLKRQVWMPLVVKGQHICYYVADFTYKELVGKKWVLVVADAKGYPSDVYKLKKKMCKAILNVDILELKA